MRTNLGISFLASRLGAGVVLAALCAFTPVSRADVWVNNTTDNGYGNAGNNMSTYQLIQEFTPNINGSIDGVALQLVFNSSYTANASYDVYFRDFAANTQILIGHVSSSTGGAQSLQTVTVLLDQGNLASTYMTAGNDYGIVLDAGSGAAPGDVGWGYTDTIASGGDSTVDDQDRYISPDGGATIEPDFTTPATAYQMYVLAVVPEVPMTGWAMGFGVLGMAVGDSLLRKFRTARGRIV